MNSIDWPVFFLLLTVGISGMVHGWRTCKSRALHCVVRGAAEMSPEETAHAVWAHDRLEKMKPWD